MTVERKEEGVLWKLSPVGILAVRLLVEEVVYCSHRGATWAVDGPSEEAKTSRETRRALLLFGVEAGRHRFSYLVHLSDAPSLRPVLSYVCEDGALFRPDLGEGAEHDQDRDGHGDVGW